MIVKIYHNPRCSKSRQTLQIIRDRGVEPEIIEYLKTSPDVQEITGLVKALGLNDVRGMMRKGEAPYKELDLGSVDKGADDLIAAMAAHPILLERPIVLTDKGARIGRPPEKVEEIL